MSDKEKFLGEFEQVVLLALLRIGHDAYGAEIRQLLHEQVNRNVAIGALYLTLERLEKKGMVNSTLGESTPERGGRAKRYFEVTGKGQKALSRSRDVFNIMWQGVTLNPSDKLTVEYIDV
jgi:DNA-binding PadR family transcriptional regulator